MLSEFKWIIGAVIAISLLIGGRTLYSMGYDARDTEILRENNIAIKAAVESARAEWQSTQAITALGIGNANDTNQKLEVIVRQTPTIQAPLCPDVGSDYSRVYNDAIRTIKAGADTGRNLPATKVPTGSTDGNARVN